MIETATAAPPHFRARGVHRSRHRVVLARTITLGGALFALLAPAAAPAAAASHALHHRGHASRGCLNSDTAANRASARALRSAVLCLINQQRTSRRLPSLQELTRLDRSAQSWTDSMIASDNFSHTSSGSDPGGRISAAGFSWSSIGENIATGFSTPRAVVSAWMGSTGHCQNILAPNFDYVGIGVSPRPIRGISSAPATWTDDFGLPAGASAPSGNWAPANRCPY